MPKKLAKKPGKAAATKPVVEKPKKAPISCKEFDCTSPSQIKGLCRLHFLKVLAGKGEGSGKPEGKLRPVRDRRNNELRQDGLAPVQPNDMAAEKVSSLGELDLDVDAPLEVTGFPDDLDFDFDDTGS